MSQKLVKQFYRVGNMIFNTRFIKHISHEPTSVKITISNTEFRRTKGNWVFYPSMNSDISYIYDISKHPKEYEQITQMIKSVVED